jgi:hypothetical protein
VKNLRAALLEALESDHERLKDIARDFGLEEVDLRSRTAILEALGSHLESLRRRDRQAVLDDLLSRLSERDVKEVCESVGIESRGRKKELIDTLLRETRKSDDDASSSRVPEQGDANGSELRGDERRLFDLVPSNGGTIGNIKLRRDLLKQRPARNPKKQPPRRQGAKKFRNLASWRLGGSLELGDLAARCS